MKKKTTNQLLEEILSEVKKLTVVEATGKPSTILKIDRSKPFDPVSFNGKEWSIAEEDKSSLALTEVNLNAIELVTEIAGRIKLDAKVFQTLWENKELIPQEWKGKDVFFDGTILVDPDGRRYTLYLYWDGGGWGWSYYPLGFGRLSNNPSAVLASPQPQNIITSP